MFMHNDPPLRVVKTPPEGKRWRGSVKFLDGHRRVLRSHDEVAACDIHPSGAWARVVHADGVVIDVRIDDTHYIEHDPYAEAVDLTPGDLERLRELEAAVAESRQMYPLLPGPWVFLRERAA